MKKILSMILALAMLISLVPAAFANDTETQAYSGVTVRYDTTGIVAKTPITNVTYDMTKGFWKVNSYSTISSNVSLVNGSRIIMGTSAGNWVALEISVPKAGKYDIKMTYSQMKNTTNATEDGKVWILPLVNPATGANYQKAEITVALNASDPINKDKPLDFYNNNSSTANPDVVDDLIGNYDFPSAGTYLVVFKAMEASPYNSSGKTYAYMYPKVITLDGDGDNAEIYTPMSLPVSVDKTNLSIDSAESKTAQITVGSSTYMSNGAAATVDTNSVSYTSSDKNVATVSETGLITAKSFGQATITTTATVSTDTDTYTASASTLIDVGAAYSGVTVKYGFGRDAGYGFANGDSLLDIKFANTKGFWQIYERSNNWAFDVVNGYCAYFTSRVDDWIALEIYVPKKGKYDVTLNYGFMKEASTSANAAQEAGMWILPLVNETTGAEYTRDQITEALTEETAQTVKLDFLNDDYTKGNSEGTTPAGSYYFPEAGSYLAVYKSLAGKSSEKAYMYLGTITLDGDGTDIAPMALIASLDKEELTLGSDTDATAQMSVGTSYMSDGTEAAVGSVSYASGKESVATVNASGLITAVGTGTATITASATATSGETSYPLSAKRNIKVVDKAATDEVSSVQFMATSTIANNAGVTTDIDGYTAGSATSEIEPGKTVVVTANDVDGYIFRGWKRGSKDNGVWVSESKVYSFPLLTNTYLTAIYDVDTATDAAVNVEFYNFNGQFIESKPVNGQVFSALKPAEKDNPTLTGHNFSFWTCDGKTAVGENEVFEVLTRVVAMFTVDTKTYAVDIGDGITGADDDSYAYDTKLELSASGKGTWYVNNKPVAYGDKYTHYVYGKANITFTAGEGSGAPILSLDTEEIDGSRMISYDANGAEIVEVGIIFGSGTPTIGSFNNGKAASKHTGKNISGQFTATGYDGTSTGARGYLIYNDNGTYRVIYAD